MLYRKNIIDFISWKEKEASALLVKGARQVGKTSLVEEFIRTSFNNYIEIDFTKNMEALNYLLEIKNYEDFISRLSLISNIELNNKEDVIFFDEIQYYYEIRNNRIERDPSFKTKYIDILTLAKEIVNKGKFRVIFSGSLLGTTVFNINLNPTGFLKTITMYPMDFEEFILGCGINSSIIDELKTSFNTKQPLSESINNLLLQKFKEYVFIGGMPKAVDGYIKDKSLNLTSMALDSIINGYKDDIIKYTRKEDRLIILEMFNLLPSEISMKNKKFIKSHLDVPNFKNIDLKDRFLWLKNAGISIPIYNVNNPKYPLKISIDNKIIKLFSNDVGLLSHQLFSIEAIQKALVNSRDIDLGSLYENAVGQILLSHNHTPYFCSTKKGGEIDFLIEKDMNIIPIEVKSGNPNKHELYSHLALDNLLEKHKEIKESYVFGISNIKQENEKIMMYPIYMSNFI